VGKNTRPAVYLKLTICKVILMMLQRFVGWGVAAIFFW
jgi:hypothetical protein